MLTIATLLTSLTILYSNMAVASVSVSGIINSDTVWTKASSPYSLTGNVLVNSGVRLTVEPGVVVNLNGFYIMVNGTLQARGTSGDRVVFNGEGSITFTQSSISWNEQAGSGCIIEYANLDSAQIGISSVSPKIISSSIKTLTLSGSPTVSNNIIHSGVFLSSESQPQITGNTITGLFQVSYSSAGSPVISHNTINSGITIGGQGTGSVSISYNTIKGEINAQGVRVFIQNNAINGKISISGGTSSSAAATITDNTISASETAIDIAIGLVSDTHAIILNNRITAGDTGINIGPGMTTTFYGGVNNATIIGNTISGCQTAAILVASSSTQGGHTPRPNTATIEKNTLTSNNYGVKSMGTAYIRGNMITGNHVGVYGGSLVQYNTITNNDYGILASSNIAHNNIHNNILYNIHLGNTELGFAQTSNVNAANNWWGTTDPSAIKASIFDFEEDFTLGKVTFEPFLSQPELEATPESFESTPINVPTPAPSQSPTAPPNQTPTPTTTPNPLSEQTLLAIIGAAIAVIVLGAGLALTVHLAKK